MALCRRAGFVVIEMLRYNGDLEDVLVALARPADEPGSSCSKADLLFFLSYRDRYAGRQEQVRRALSRFGGDGGHVALFGAGHQSIMFANALKAAPLLSYVVDDDPKKVGMIAPGFSSEIRSSADLIDDAQIRACLLGVSPRAEPKVRSQLAKALRTEGAASIRYSREPWVRFSRENRNELAKAKRKRLRRAIRNIADHEAGAHDVA